MLPLALAAFAVLVTVWGVAHLIEVRRRRAHVRARLARYSAPAEALALYAGTVPAGTGTAPADRLAHHGSTAGAHSSAGRRF